MREKGDGALPKPVLLPQAKSLCIPSRQGGRDIPCRLLVPEGGGQVKGVFLHIHGGGWVLGDEKQYHSP